MNLSGNFSRYFLDESKSLSREGTHIFFYEEVPIKANNFPLLTLSQIIKSVMSSKAKSELEALFITTTDMAPSSKPSSKLDAPNQG